MNTSIFREYDIRAVVDVDLTDEEVTTLGQAFGTFLRDRQVTSAVLGWDSRASSPRWRDRMTEGLIKTGIHVIDIGQVTTPIFYFARIHFDQPAGVMITASHNPAEFNGFKLAYGPATIYGEDIQEVRRIMERGEFAEGRGSRTEANPVPAYLTMLKEKIRLGPRRPKVVVDCGNGTPSLFAQDVMKAFGVEAIPLYCTPDPTFPHHHPDPVVAKNLTDLIAAVKREGADLGVAFDGDGDRIGVVDETGEIIWGDRLMVLYWREIAPKYPGTPAIIEVKCSQTLYDEVARLGAKPLFYKTGHSLIKAKMREMGAVFTGEMSGHMFFADEYYGYDDAFYAAGRLFRILSETDAPLSRLLADVPHLPATPEIRIDCPDEQKMAVVASLQKTYQARSDVSVIDVDGLRVVFPYGWGLIRASNTQPALVARAEADTEEHLKMITEDFDQALRQFPFVPPVDWSGE
ncbi:phosphomannomutase [Sulfobacillus acidophilus TPY]|uniref:Phosphoglucomutase/phosphomannomutase alpha/beta/alpha domain II n=1 Tax=Sulfobacillus acidophilus (strain ATCC 700253 / DSM 10332 / NAL) TaxID=679936 RepID=G8TZ64_SULAD|nr:phosphomannomutase [Sulfobacillus acidophilus TPY]AEW06334.1 phosphoglucomutase/phosphomannomutase alpha/beta/alpha domain II [Sulfobacillus acidophilus DSM 10332]